MKRGKEKMLFQHVRNGHCLHENCMAFGNRTCIWLMLRVSVPSEPCSVPIRRLVLESGIKERLLHSASTGLLFSAAGVDTNIIAWNRVVLLHGPPGTGKTSLCQALAQKLSIRLGHRFPAAQLLEINAHSLFSKWFSESGKLVQKLFDHIHELLDDADTLVFVLIGKQLQREAHCTI